MSYVDGLVQCADHLDQIGNVLFRERLIPHIVCSVCSLAEGGFLEYFRFQPIVSYSKASRFKIGEGTSVVAWAIINEGQCQGGTEFAAKLETPIGCWFRLAVYSNPIIRAFIDDEEGSIILGFGPDGLERLGEYDFPFHPHPPSGCSIRETLWLV